MQRLELNFDLCSTGFLEHLFILLTAEPIATGRVGPRDDEEGDGGDDAYRIPHK
jgi:hypothetical protein